MGDRVRLGGGVGVADHVRIGDYAVVAAGSGVGSNLAPGAFVSGYPAQPHQRSVEQHLYLGRQRRLHDRVAAMASRLEELEKIVDQGGKK
jgi:UDP-3-O-[3-hydroxymyristoyl] glucosamine N-acyltransferase